MKIYIINLKRRPDRRESILSQFEKLGITNFEFVDAVDGQLVNPDVEANRKLMDRFACKMSNNEIACAMSHRLVYQKMIESGERGIVLEDDAIIDDSFADIIDSNINDDIDIMFFGYFTSNIRNKHAKPLSYCSDLFSKVISEKGETTLCYFKNNSLDINGNTFYKIDSQSYDIDFLHGAHAYSPSIELCKHICKIQNKIIYTADGVFNNLRRFDKIANYYAPLVPIVNQDVLSESDLIEFRIPDGLSKEYTNRILSDAFGT